MEENLYKYWHDKEHLRAEPASQVKPWVEQQIGGLIGALDHLHDYFNCRHGGLKPDNILVFDLNRKGFGRLAIADFGLTRVHEDGTKDRNEATTSMSGAQRYEPPEANKCHPDHDSPRSRQYDIWSLGRIFLAFIVWLCRGKEGLEEIQYESW